jgi:hypothetical protein
VLLCKVGGSFYVDMFCVPVDPIHSTQTMPYPHCQALRAVL